MHFLVPALPERGPELKLNRNLDRFGLGDIIYANCTSSRSRPAAKLQFLLDGEPVSNCLQYNYFTYITLHQCWQYLGKKRYLKVSQIIKVSKIRVL